MAALPAHRRSARHWHDRSPQPTPAKSQVSSARGQWMPEMARRAQTSEPVEPRIDARGALLWPLRVTPETSDEFSREATMPQAYFGHGQQKCPAGLLTRGA